MLGISAVERETGISKDTLRVWERRYGFPRPVRNLKRERLYPTPQLEKLRMVRQLQDRGFRAHEVVPARMPQLRKLLSTQTTTGKDRGEEPSATVLHLLELLSRREFDELRQELAVTLMKVGLERFTYEVVVPLMQLIGDSWACGRLYIADEHLFSNLLKSMMREVISLMDGRERRPRILLATCPGEEHELGLLMAQAIFTLQGTQCVSLGAQLPLKAIAEAARVYRTDIVAVSFSRAARLDTARNLLRNLRAQLAPQTALWAGGGIWSRRQHRIEGVTTIPSLEDVGDLLAAWRADN